ncbi:hypothetical protein B0O99DRAFT_744892 [Bisporella sp. PMI_857]|nr:hypothetical protein B0O99DRAFT_744892 [Bisporella sp. PMI_857]
MTSTRAGTILRLKKPASKAKVPLTLDSKQSALRSPPTLRTSGMELVTLDVTDMIGNKKCFVLHKSFVTHYSPMLNASFNGPFSEGLTQLIEYSTMSINAFGIFTDWLYSQKIASVDGSLPSVTDLIHLWILADNLIIPTLQNQTIQAISEVMTPTDKPESFILHTLYNNTMANSPLRQILADMFVSHAFVIDEEIEHHFPREILLDMINSAARSTPKKTAKLSKSKMAKYLISVDDVRRR